MNFVTPEFAVFFVLVLGLCRFCAEDPNRRLWFNMGLLGAGLVFYASAGLIFVPLLLTVAAINWACARLMCGAEPKRRRAWLWLTVAGNLSLLGFFKYYEFMLVSLEGLGLQLISANSALLELAFPVGLSFYTFQGLSYVIDCYREPARAPESFSRVLLFVSFFPTVMSGPILRSGQFLPQLDSLRVPDTEDVAAGCSLIVSGLFKKVVLASYLSEHVVREVFQTPELFSSWSALAAVYAYSLQIYCDFSGYSDMATGFARLMGFRLPENFRAPYMAVNLQDFWRRWHITLSLWLRDYLYIPLGGNRKGNRALNLIVTMFLGGLWHGSHTRFLLWGLMHGLGLTVVHGFGAVWGRVDAALNSRFGKQDSLRGRLAKLDMLRAPLGWFLTFHFVSALWVFFRADDMERALEILRRAVVWGLPGEGFPLLVIPAVLAGLALQVVGPAVHNWFTRLQIVLPWPVQGLLLAVTCGAILKLGPDGVLPFIYFQF